MRHTLSIFTGAALAALLFFSPAHASQCTPWYDTPVEDQPEININEGDIYYHPGYQQYFLITGWNEPSIYSSNIYSTTSCQEARQMVINAYSYLKSGTTYYTLSANQPLFNFLSTCTTSTTWNPPRIYATRRTTTQQNLGGEPSNICPDSVQDTVPPPADSDGDGWPDIIDPFPNSGEPFDFWLSHWVTDSSGNVIWAIMVSEDSNGTQVASEVGNVDAYRDCLMNQCQEYGGHIYYDLNGNLRYRSDQDKIYTGEGNIGILPLNDPLHGGYSPTPLTAPSPGAFSPAPPTETSFDSGTQPTLSDSDSELLHKIASNTAGTTANIGELSKLLSDISGGIAGSLATTGSHTDLLKKIAENTGKSTGGSGGSGGTSITGDVSVQTSATEQEATQDALDTASDFGDDAIFDDTVDEWLPEAEDWGSMMTGFLNTNPVSAWLSGTHIETSSATCVISGTISTGGQSWTLKFDFCQWDYIFELMGTVFLSLSYLIGIMMVCRR
jgi:hypothetical protein